MKVKTMTNFNPALTIEEATAIFKFKGVANWVDSRHNREIMAGLAQECLKKLHGKK